MLSILLLVLPVFGLILAGWLSRRFDVLGPAAMRELNRFVVYLALPALMFDIVANARWSDVWRPDFIAVFGLGAAAVFAISVAISLWRRRHLADAAVEGLNAGYANTGFLGFPLVLGVIGPTGLTPTLIATILTVCILFAAAMVIMEFALQAERPGKGGLGRVALSLAKNPMLASSAAGGVALGLGLHPPAPAETFIKLLAGAASPCALVALGLFLAEKRPAADAPPSAVARLALLKLVGQPLITWALAIQVFHLPADATRVAVLLAALPTGTGPFMTAEYFGRDATLTARVILVTTVCSLVTVTAYLTLAR